jgi:hypothetical protein
MIIQLMIDSLHHKRGSVHNRYSSSTYTGYLDDLSEGPRFAGGEGVRVSACNALIGVSKP